MGKKNLLPIFFAEITKESIVSFPFHHPFSPSVNCGSSLDIQRTERKIAVKED